MIINNNIFRYSFVALHDPNSGSFMMNKKGAKKERPRPVLTRRFVQDRGFESGALGKCQHVLTKQAT